MTDSMLRVENLGKMYHIGVAQQQKNSTLIGKVSKGILAPVRRMIDPRLARSGADAYEELWALRNVSFELKRGEVLGIIGRNGSGKSTLLKLISHVTAPSEGRIMLNGKVGSLLEVGVGFHPDLTGRENIYLSGAVQGFKKSYIDRMFDEIVDFSEIEHFIDTPVKRYSSGMYVRLAFSVAAHFNQDILILDEVLAVGDAAFQKKCIEKMERVAKSGKTVLFVSHGMPNVTRMCDYGLYLINGSPVFMGSAKDAVSKYLKDMHKLSEERLKNEEALPAYVDLRESENRWEGYSRKIISFVSTHRMDGSPSAVFKTGDGMRIRIGYHLDDEVRPYNFQINFLDYAATRVMQLHNTHNGPSLELKGEGYIEILIEDIRLLSEQYIIMAEIVDQKTNQWLDCVPDTIHVKIETGDYLGGVGLTLGQVTFAQRSYWKDCQI